MLNRQKYWYVLIGIFIIISDLLFNLLQESFKIGKLDTMAILFGCLLVSYPILSKYLEPIISIYTYISKYTYIFLGFLLLIGFYLRIHNLAYVPFGNPPHTVDEFATISTAIGVLQHGSPVLPSGMIYDRAILNTYLIATAFGILGINEFAARIVSVIFGSLMIPLTYLYAKDISSDKEYSKGLYIYIGLIAVFLITFSQWEISSARQARMYAQFQFLYLLTAYLFYRGLKRNSYILLLLSLFTFYLTFLSHRLSLTFVPVALIYIIYYKKYYKKEQLLKLLKYKYIPVLLFFSFILIYFIFAGINLIPKQIPEGRQGSVFFYSHIYSQPSYDKKDSANIGWKKACLYVKTNMKQNDLIISTITTPTYYYLGKKADYWLRQYDYRIYSYTDSKGDLRAKGSGSIILKDYETFIQAIEHSHGWIIVDTKRFEGSIINTTTRDYIKENMMFHPEGSDENVQVYSWSNI